MTESSLSSSVGPASKRLPFGKGDRQWGPESQRRTGGWGRGGTPQGGELGGGGPPPLGGRVSEPWRTPPGRGRAALRSGTTRTNRRSASSRAIGHRSGGGR